MTRKVKQACVNCHYFKQHNASHPNGTITRQQREAVQKKDFLWLNDAFALACHRGIWDEGIDPELKNRRYEIVDKERGDTCFFYEFMPGMTFQAAQDLQAKAVDTRSVTYIAGDQFNQTGNFQGANIKSNLKDVTQTVEAQITPMKLPQNISYRADIHLEVQEYDFGRSFGSRRSSFRDTPTSRGGFNKQGVPDWGTLWANHIRIANHGFEDGQLIWEIDPLKTKLPSLFAFEDEKYRVEFYPPPNIPGREVRVVRFFFDILLTEREPKAFAQALKMLIEGKERYQVVIRYQTRRVDGKSEFRELCLEGDFQSFHQDVVKYWEEHGFNNLAELARIN